jgi:hypothetical protein
LKFIEVEVIGNDYINNQRRADANGQSGDVDEGKYFIFPKMAGCGFEAIYQHFS